MDHSVVREDRPAPPPLFYAALEGGRCVGEWASLRFMSPLLKAAPLGDGHAVLFLPGFGAGDDSTRALRDFFEERNYLVRGWGLGQNLGRQTVGPHLEPLTKRVLELKRLTGRRVSLVGWSLGGVLAREVARQTPQLIRQVITLGSPIHGDPRSTNVWRVMGERGESYLNSDKMKEHFQRRLVPPPGIPCTAIYSKTDGIVAWRASREMPSAHTDNIEVVSSHFGMGFHPAVYLALADRLALPESEWKPFRRVGWKYFVYPSSGH